jgi:hypothetical protein
MYRCQLCGGAAPAGTRAVKVVVAVRSRAYPFRRDANTVRKQNLRTGKWEWKTTDDPGGAGWEIDREVTACPGCAAAHPGPVTTSGGTGTG